MIVDFFKDERYYYILKHRDSDKSIYAVYNNYKDFGLAYIDMVIYDNHDIDLKVYREDTKILDDADKAKILLLGVKGVKNGDIFL